MKTQDEQTGAKNAPAPTFNRQHCVTAWRNPMGSSRFWPAPSRRTSYAIARRFALQGSCFCRRDIVNSLYISPAQQQESLSSAVVTAMSPANTSKWSNPISLSKQGNSSTISTSVAMTLLNVYLLPCSYIIKFRTSHKVIRKLLISSGCSRSPEKAKATEYSHALFFPKDWRGASGNFWIMASTSFALVRHGARQHYCRKVYIVFSA